MIGSLRPSGRVQSRLIRITIVVQEL
jgi:hypothetical protein